MKKSRSLLVGAPAVLALLAIAVLAACGSGSGSTTSSGSSPNADVATAAKADSQLSQFSAALDAAGLAATLLGKGPYTVFAPTNDALKSAGGTLSGDALKATVIEGQELAKADLAKGTKNDSMLADNTIVTYTGTDGALYVNTYKVAGTPISSGNGLVYPISGVIEPK
jgi:uncharacterized surface protein with fasciclin (FAS1) repeats